MPHHEKEPERGEMRQRGEQQAREEGVEVKATGSKQWMPEYKVSDLDTVYRRGHWTSWQQMIDWLRKNGERDNELTPGEVTGMIGDLERLAKSGKPFSNNPDEVYKLLRGSREHHEGTHQERPGSPEHREGKEHKERERH